MTAPQKQLRGFANLTAEERSEAGRIGGIAAHESGRAHKFTQQEAREAGRKGARVRRSNRLAAAVDQLTRSDAQAQFP